jgi:hypothetical protein
MKLGDHDVNIANIGSIEIDRANGLIEVELQRNGVYDGIVRCGTTARGLQDFLQSYYDYLVSEHREKLNGLFSIAEDLGLTIDLVT